MADVRNIDDMEELSVVTVSAKVLAKIVKVGERQVRNLADIGVFKRNRHGQYLLIESLANYIVTLKVKKAGEAVKAGLDDNLDLNTEKAAHEHLKSMITEIKLQLIRGQVHKAEDVERVMTDMFEKFRSKMSALPAKLAPKLEGKDKIFIQDRLVEEIYSALLELSAYNAMDFYSDEHIEIEDEDVMALGEEEE